MEPDVLWTNRLYAVPLTCAHLPYLQALDADPEVMKYIGQVRSKEMVQARVDKVLAYQKSNPGFGLWSIYTKMNERWIGWICLKHLDQSDHIEVGYRLAQKAWHKGYATEISKRIIQYGFEVKQLDEIVGVTDPVHIRSQNVLMKCGLKFIDVRFFYGKNLKFFSLSKRIWAKNMVK